MKLIFVCSGNTCRSPLALAAWRALPCSPVGVEATSAGLFATSGAPASASVVEIARDWNVDLRRHRARSLNERLLRNSDLICVMTREHAQQVISRASSLQRDMKKRVVLLGQFAAWPSDAEETNAHRLQSLLADSQTSPKEIWNENLDAAMILDPFGGSHEAYQSCAAQIRRAVRGLSEAMQAGYFAS